MMSNQGVESMNDSSKKAYQIYKRARRNMLLTAVEVRDYADHYLSAREWRNSMATADRWDALQYVMDDAEFCAAHNC